MKSTVSEKGQVTIPKALRDKLGLRAGQVLEFEARGGALVGRKSRGQGRAVDRLFGILPHLDVDKEIERFRGKPWQAGKDGSRADRR